MTTGAGDRLADLLAGEAAKTPSSVRLRAQPDDLRLAVQGVGRIRLPVAPHQARQLCRLSGKARFGRGVETLTDPEVRDTWEVPTSLVRVEWGDAFAAILDTVRHKLGLPSGCELVADLHSMLVYEPGQFFVAHQDSEKDDAMIGTLVVALPSEHAGGALVIDHGGATTTYRGSRSALALVAFYAGCRHEVRTVKSGHRITLTYNLLLSGDSTWPVADEDPTVGELARCLDEHFTSRVTRPYGRGEADPPDRLVYLLDHEYTARGLSWSRLKGTDAYRASLLRAAADRSGCETVLALTDIRETWSAFEPEPEYGYRRGSHWYRDDDHSSRDDHWSRDGDSDPDAYELGELVDSSVQLLRWTGPAGAGLEEVSLTVRGAEVYASTPSTDLAPYASEYEGYMGNYGNTMDRWYRRAALVVWPHDRALRNRAEAAPAWALDELSARVRAKDLAGARAAAATLAPVWDAAARVERPAKLLAKALRTATALDDAEIAGMLLRPFRVESLGPSHVPPLARLAGHYGEHWIGELLPVWFDDQGDQRLRAQPDRPGWVASLPGLCAALHDKGRAGTATAHRLLRLSWARLAATVRHGIAAPAPSYRAKLLGSLGQPLAAVLTGAVVTGATGLRDEVVGFCRQQKDEVIACVVPALRAGPHRDSALDELAADCAARLRARLARPPRTDDDWSIEPPGGCPCDLCGTLGAFLRDPVRRSLEWPLAKQGRQHVHSRIDLAELPVGHETRRTGRPYTLVLTKRQALFDDEKQQLMRDQTDLAWLVDQYAPAR